MPQPFDPDLLELRIHGVRNTPAHLMLGTDAANVTSSRGDGLAGFSTTRRRTVPHRLEAYTWGRLARFTGVPTLGRIGDALVRVLWFSLAPFGLSNAAYWARLRLGTGAGRTEQERTEDLLGRGPGAGTIRLLGLLLTLLYVTTAATVALDMALPSALDLLPRVTADWRAGMLIPVGALAVVGLLSQLARTRYLPGPRLAPGEPATLRPSTRGRIPGDCVPVAGDGQGPDAGPVPVLAHRELWRVGSGMRRLSWLHTAAALAWTGGIEAVARLDVLLGQPGLPGRPAVPGVPVPGEAPGLSGPTSWGWLAITAAAVLAVACTSVLVVRSQAHAPHEPTPVGHRAIAAVGAAVFVAALVLALVDDEARPGGRGGALAATAVCLSMGVVVLVILGRSASWSARLPAPSRAALGWQGQGPFVFAACAVGFGLLLSFGTVMLAGWIVVDAAPPMVFTLYAAGFALLVAGSLAVLAFVLVMAWSSGRGRAVGELVDVRVRLVADAGRWADEAVIDAAARKVWASRRLTSLLRRAEIAAHWLSFAIVLGLLAGAVVGVLWLAGWRGPGWFWAGALAAGDVGLWAGVLLVVALGVISSRHESRPFALLWDLMCFLPTQAHPFGPPCYSERVVPEMTERVADWLEGDGSPDTAGERGPAPGRRRVILSAHSMGLVLTVCVLFHLSACGLSRPALDRIGLLSYGSQPRRYFARFFPQVLGPQVMSIVPAASPDAGGRDPWPPLLRDEVRQETDAGWTPEPGSPGPKPGPLWELLGERWTNLYRPNDPLGFPVRYGTRFPADDMDVQAEEFVPDAYQFTVATHGGYLETAAYAREFERLVGRLPRPRESGDR